MTFAAAALAATVIAAPVAAQTTTGTLIGTIAQGFTFPTTATLNSNREWEITYSADLSPVIENLLTNCNLDGTDCAFNLPYIMRYGVWTQGKNACVFEEPPQSAINGISGRLTLTAWTQTLRTKPGTSYCLAMYSSDSGTLYSNKPFAGVYFTTPADPNPPSTPWAPTPGSSGCFAETTQSLVQSCLNCKYVQTDRRWDANTNQCVLASS
ncbi:MAG: hypothetical protein OXC62_13080 [Aestuariivita sp.]|nr:hypothetical protein [Aestuariivita sp.]